MGAIGIHHTATVDSPWDGPGAESKMPNDASVLRYTHAWVDSQGDPSVKASYKFPHHMTKGGPANLPAVRNALARLSQADIPASERAGVEAHLRAHLADAKQSSNSFSGNVLQLMESVRNLVPSTGEKWYEIKDSSATAEVVIYDKIGYPGVTAKEFAKDLGSLKADSIKLRMNSLGGDVFDGVAIYNTLKSHPANISVVIEGVAASAGSFIAMAGDTVTMAPSATMMIHDAQLQTFGNAANLRDAAELLDRISNTIAGIYAERTKTDMATWREKMKNETWFNAQEAIDAGLIDGMTNQETVTNESNAFYEGSLVFEPPVVGSASKVSLFNWNPEEFRRALKEASSG